MKFCIWHDSCPVVACAQICSDRRPYNWYNLSILNCDGKHVRVWPHDWYIGIEQTYVLNIVSVKRADTEG